MTINLADLAEAIRESGSDALEPLHPIVWEKCRARTRPMLYLGDGPPTEEDREEERLNQERFHRERCRCKGTRYILRDAFWDAAPQGALAGALGKRVMEIIQNVDLKMRRAWLFALDTCQMFDNQAAVEAVTKAVREMKP